MREAIAADVIATRFANDDYLGLVRKQCKCEAMCGDKNGYMSYLICSTARALISCVKRGSYKGLCDLARKELLLAMESCAKEFHKRDETEPDEYDWDIEIGIGEYFSEDMQNWRYNGGKYTYLKNSWEAAIRAIPAAYVGKTEREVVRLARTIARVTHETQEAVLGAEALSVAVYLALCGHTKAEIQEAIAERYYPELLPECDEKGYYTAADYTVGKALKNFFDSCSYENAIERTVFNYPEMCLTGAIAGAFYGLQDSDSFFKKSLTDYVRNSLLEFTQLCPVRLVFSVKKEQDSHSLWLGERLASAFSEGQFVRRDAKNARMLAQKLMLFGSGSAKNLLGEQLIYGEYSSEFDVETGLKMLEANAEDERHGAVACFILGEYYLNGRGTFVDKERAFSYFSKGVEYDDYCCYLPYIKCLAFGWGTKKEEAKAYGMLKEHIEESMGLEDSYALFGRFYEEGIGIAEPDYNLACYYYMLGLLNSDKRREQIRSKKYSAGELAARYNEETVIDNAESENGLGRLYEKGNFLSKDEEQAYRHYLRASELGDSLGTFNVARCYLYGIYVQRDPSKAMSLMMKAVNQDSGCEGHELAIDYAEYCYAEEEKDRKARGKMTDNKDERENG